MKTLALRLLASTGATLACALAGNAFATAIPVVNPGFESTKPGINGNPEGWATFQHAGPISFDFALDSGVKHAGTQSMRIRRFGPEVYGTVSQVVPAAAYAGRKVRFTAWMKTEAPAPVAPDESAGKPEYADAAQRGARSVPRDESREGQRRGAGRKEGSRQGAGLILIALRGSSILESELMQRSQVRGTTPWTRRSIELEIPKQANNIEIGAMLQGPGTVWIDEVMLEVVDP